MNQAPDLPPSGRRRVAVTGLGCISPVGNDRRTTWTALCEGRSGIAPITRFDASDLPSRIAGEVKGFDPTATFGVAEARRTSRAIQLGMVAAREALADSALDIGPIAEDVAVIMASGVGGIEFTERASLAYRDRGYKRVSPFTATSMLVDMPAGMIATDVGAQGPNFAIVSACASGAHAIGEAAEQIRRGDAVAALAGGTEGAITGVGMASFCIIGALSRRNDDPERASRPFDRDRDGFVAAEGSAVLVLEEWEHARERGAHVYAELVGYGATADAGHVTQPEVQGSGARRCIERALARAGLEPVAVGYVNAHGTATPLNDVAETRAMHAVLGPHAPLVPLSSTKSMTGHLMGAAGALEALVAVLAIHEGFLPPTINLDDPDPECDLDYVPHVGRAARPEVALTTSFGFGGHNACLAFAAPGNT
ncbi:MAG: beta-ketoacyl-ACP synthase II [Acidimicrobiales bacterium]|nr:beta-ketoacyl-ACP synthase II [Actinomycetota bacterium]